MSDTVAKLRAMPLEELIKRHDAAATNTVVGTRYYLEEIARRDREKTDKILIRLTYALVFLTLVIAALTIVLLFKG